MEQRFWIGRGISRRILLPCMLLMLGLASTGQAEKKIGLALSGGGARGAAHVGVIRALEEMGVPISYIAGTSIGAIVGGLYACGYSGAELEKAVATFDWFDTLDDRTARQDLPMRRKRDDDLYLIKSKPGIQDGELVFPQGLLDGQKVTLALQRLLEPCEGTHDFDDLRIPFRAVATDLARGTEVVLGSGDIARVIRASMSIPGLLVPVAKGNTILVDGGIANNLPVNVVRRMGADIVIAVDISTPLSDVSELASIVGVVDQLTNILTQASTQRQKALLTETDFLIEPDLGDLTTLAFDDAAQAIKIGYESTQAHTQLLRLADRRKGGSTKPANWPPSAPISFVRITNNSRLDDRIIRNKLHVPLGEPLDVIALEQDIAAIYGMDLFDSVSYQQVHINGEHGLVVVVDERAIGPEYLQFGLSLSSDFEGAGRQQFALGFLRTELNDRGGEFRASVQFGVDELIALDYYQPLDYSESYFLQAILFGAGRNVDAFSVNERVAQYRVRSLQGELALGRNFGNKARFSVGARFNNSSAKLRIGEADRRPDFDANDQILFSRFLYDNLDSLAFPTNGAFLRVEYSGGREEIDGDEGGKIIRVSATNSLSFRRNTLDVGLELQITTDGRASLDRTASLGGFLNLSGLEERELSGGQHAMLLKAVYLRHLSKQSDGATVPVFLGVSLEAGNIWQDLDQVSLESLIFGGSLFLGAETPLGPAYLGLGLAEGNQQALYFSLGRSFR